jgi:ABC-type enterobactin transport system permease subunit
MPLPTGAFLTASERPESDVPGVNPALPYRGFVLLQTSLDCANNAAPWFAGSECERESVSIYWASLVAAIIILLCINSCRDEHS